MSSAALPNVVALTSDRKPRWTDWLGLFLIVYGIYSLAGNVVSLSYGRLNLDLGFFATFLGIGIRQYSWRFAGLFIGVTMIFGFLHVLFISQWLSDLSDLLTPYGLFFIANRLAEIAVVAALTRARPHFDNDDAKWHWRDLSPIGRWGWTVVTLLFTVAVYATETADRIGVFREAHRHLFGSAISFGRLAIHPA